MYVGDIEVPDSSGDWLLEAREDLRRLRCRALLDAAEAAASLCWMRDSLELAQRAADLDLGEEAARALMRALAGVGEIGKALDVFDKTRRSLADCYGVDPSPQTRALHLQLLTGTAAEHEEVGLVGHEEAVDALAATAAGMLRSGGCGGIVWLVGEPGSGRDSVAEAACRQAELSMHDMGRDSWLQRPGEMRVPLWEMPDSDVVVMPHADAVPSHAMKVLDTVARRHGGVLVVPVRRAPVLPAADETEPVSHEIVRVGPLTNDELAELTSVVLQGRPGARLLQQIRAASGGLSGEACRVARGWLSQGRVVWSVGGLELAETQAGKAASTSGTLRRRLRMLSPFAEDVVEVLAVASAQLDEQQLTDVVLSLREGGVVADVAEALDQLVDSGLVVRGDAGFTLRESHAGPELLSWMRPGARQRIHRLVADRVTLPLPDRVGHLIASGQHQPAEAVGSGEAEAQALTSQVVRQRRSSLLRHGAVTARRAH